MGAGVRGAIGGIALVGSLLWYDPTIFDQVAAVLGPLARRWIVFSLTYPVLSTLLLAASSIVVVLPLGVAVVEA